MYSVHRRAIFGCLSSIPAFRLLIGGGLLVAASLLVGCGSEKRLDRLDLEARSILHEQQRRSLGEDARYGDLTPPTPAVVESPELYERDPATNNTPAAGLPTESAPESERVAYPDVLDDGSRPETLRLDLEDVLATAIAHGPDYRREKEDLFLTTLSLIVERHAWGPRFFSALTGRVEGVPEEGDTETALNLIASLGVTQRLPYGGTISAAALVDYVRLLQQSSGSDLPDETDVVELQVSLDLPLLRGAGRASQTVESRLQAERDLVYAVREFERFRRAFFVDLATTYFDLVRRQRQLANQELQLRNLENASTLFLALAEAGRVAYFSAFRAQQRMLRARNSLLNQQEAYVRQVELLKLRLGIDPTRPVEIVPVEIEIPEVLLDAELAVTTGLRERLDLQNRGDSITDARRRVMIARNGLLPDLDLTANAALPTDETVRSTDLDFEFGEARYEAALTLSLPLDRKIEYTDYRASLIRLERSERDYQVERDRVALEVRQAVRAIEQSRFVVQLQDEAVAINERRAQQIEINARDLGPKELIDVQEDLLDARNDRDAAVSELRVSILEYLLATGQIRVDARGRWRSPGELLPAGVNPLEGPVVDTMESLPAAGFFDAEPVETPADIPPEAPPEAPVE